MTFATAKIPSPQSIAAVLSPSDPAESIANTSSSSTPKRQYAEAFLRPTSPTEPRLLEDSRALATHGPHPVGGADDDSGNMNRGEVEGKKPAKMRSSIACSRCRKSKIKCLNNGNGTQCGACANNGKECVYPIPTLGSSSTPKRSEPPNGMRADGESDTKRVKRRETESSRKHSLRDNGDPLESPPITRKMWEQIYAAFMLHFSTDLPFLHEATFNNRIVAQAPSTRSPEIQDFLLGMLTLTARFVPELVEYHSPGSKDPLAASEFYANALISRLDGRALMTRSLERCQALLMLTLYTWGELQGGSSWTWLGLAIS